jgi:hypothetical protein
MKKLLLTICLLIPISTYAEQSTTIGSLSIKMQDGNDDWIEVYKDGKPILEEKCAGMMCEIYVVKSESFDFRFEDGLVKPDGRTVFRL